MMAGAFTTEETGDGQWLSERQKGFIHESFRPAYVDIPSWLSVRKAASCIQHTI